MISKQIKRGIQILSNPSGEFSGLDKRTLEEAVSDYMKLLIASALAAGVFNFIFSFLKVFYLDLFTTVDINYWRMLNFTSSISTSLVFLFIFIGTFVMFFITVLIKILFSKRKYVNLIKIVLYSSSPLLLFGWVAINPMPLIIWCLFLLAVGLKSYKGENIKKDSINQRD